MAVRVGGLRWRRRCLYNTTLEFLGQK